MLLEKIKYAKNGNITEETGHNNAKDPGRQRNSHYNLDLTKLVKQNVLPGIWEIKILFRSKLDCFQICTCLLCSFLI